MIPRLAGLVAVLGALLPGAGWSQETTTIRGITMSTHTDGRDWAHDGIVPALAAMSEVGANWVAIHPYAGVQRDGTVRYWPLDPEDPPEWIARPIREAHALGLKVLIKPHLAYWGSGFSWRGEIDFTEPAQWERFWSTYTAWITAVAAASQEADGFVVGTELSRTHDQAPRWRAVIAAVRGSCSLPLTYAANWHDYGDIAFWDALDVIGIQAYFPVAEEPGAGEDDLARGWERIMADLSEFSRRQGKHIVFTELGYNWSHRAPVEPWDYRTDGAEAEAVQLRCLRAALDAVEREPAVIGSFLWKWFPEPRPVGRNFPLATPGSRALLQSMWAR